jgi:uncharacterized protein (DUF1697 family)
VSRGGASRATGVVALFRGINVGKAKRIAMADLKRVLESLGYRDVRTLLNSGNAVFTTTGAGATSAAKRIRAAVHAELGVDARVTTVDADLLDAALAVNPLRAAAAKDPSHVLLGVPESPAALRELADVAKRDWGPEKIVLGDTVAYFWFGRGMAASPLMTAVDRVLRDRITSRNVTTIAKLVALARAGADDAAAVAKPRTGAKPGTTRAR